MKLFMQVLFVVGVVAGETGLPAEPETPLSPNEENAWNALYPSSDVDDHIRDLTQHRDEQRDGFHAVPETPLSPDEEAARNARYSFSSDVEDHISDLTQHRDEQRDGLNVKGSYSYSDGFFSRKVVYEADENGYRVISDEMVPLQGPRGDPAGTASVHTQVDGAETNYTLTTPQKKKNPRTDPTENFIELSDTFTTQPSTTGPLSDELESRF